jgi:tRNA(Ile)-lysidine synthase
VASVLQKLPSTPDAPYVVAVSGGPDSVALLDVLKRIYARLGSCYFIAAHLNHRIRGAEADRDEAFVRKLCEKLGIELIVECAHGLSSPNLEERARVVRYEFLDRVARSIHARYILLAHHADDQAETALLRLLRGSGIAGLGAMAPVVSRRGEVSADSEPSVGVVALVRPMLSVTRTTIVDYLEAVGADYVIDSSNLVGGVLRNRLRHSLLPEIEKHYAPGFSRRLVELAAEAGEVEAFLAGEARRALDLRLTAPSGGAEKRTVWRIDVEGFSSIQPALASAMLRELVRRGAGDLRHFGRVHIEAMRRLAMGGDPSAITMLPRGWRFRREYQSAVLERSPSTGREFGGPQGYELELTPGENRIEDAHLMLQLRIIGCDDSAFPHPPWHRRDLFEAWFDAVAAGRIVARTARHGDRVKPLGMDGSRKVHDVFVDRNLPLGWRKVWPLVVAQEGVLWIPGMVRSRFALVTADSKKVLHLRANSATEGRNVPLPEL